eukprot:Skav224167  [mRNA]  locus=scaffold2007:306188:307354:+ [translate_table: standard]
MVPSGDAQWWGQPHQECTIILVADQQCFRGLRYPGVVWTPTEAPCGLRAAAQPSVQTCCDQPVEDRTDLDTTPRNLVPTLEAEDGDQVARAVATFRPSSSAARRLRRKRALERQRQAADPQELDMKKLRSMLDCGEVTGVAKQMRGHVYMLARHPVQCRMLQEVLEACSSQQAQELVQELKGYVWELATCPHGNFTIQKVISHLSPAASDFVAWELRGYAVQAAKHTQACRILCRLLEFRGSGSGATWYLIEELMEVVDKMCTHKLAHHVIESVLEHGEAEHRQRIADVLLSDGLRFATDKQCSYLIEKMLCYCSVVDQEKLIDTLGTPEMLLELATTKYGSFVARALLRDDRVDYEGAMWIFKQHQRELEQSKYGLRFLSDLGLKSD